MDAKTFSLVAGVIFAVVSLFHLARIFMGWTVIIGDWSIPMQRGADLPAPLCLLAVPTRGRPLVTTLSQRALATRALTRPSGMASSGSAGRNRRATRGLRSP